MKKIILQIICLALIIFLTGCQDTYPEMKEDAIGFHPSSFEYGDEGFQSIEYNGRTYIMYGTIKNGFDYSELDKCIGYLHREEIESSNEDRFYTLKSDPDENFLYERYIGTTLMNPPSFFRAVDTKDVDINIPKYIESFEYEFWN